MPVALVLCRHLVQALNRWQHLSPGCLATIGGPRATCACRFPSLAHCIMTFRYRGPRARRERCARARPPATQLATCPRSNLQLGTRPSRARLARRYGSKPTALVFLVNHRFSCYQQPESSKFNTWLTSRLLCAGPQGRRHHREAAEGHRLRPRRQHREGQGGLPQSAYPS
jgi:hypothetical protein